MKKHNLIPASLILVFSLLVAGATMASAVPQVEKVHSKAARVTYVSLEQEASRLTVSGMIKKSYQRRGRIPGELVVSLIGGDDQVLEQKFVHYHRRNSKSARAYFVDHFTTPSDAVARVRVRHVWPRQF